MHCVRVVSLVHGWTSYWCRLMLGINSQFQPMKHVTQIHTVLSLQVVVIVSLVIRTTSQWPALRSLVELLDKPINKTRAPRHASDHETTGNHMCPGTTVPSSNQCTNMPQWSYTIRCIFAPLNIYWLVYQTLWFTIDLQASFSSLMWYTKSLAHGILET